MLVLEAVVTILETVLVDITHRPEHHPRVGVDRLIGRTGASPTTTDQPDLESVASRRGAPDRHREASDRACRPNRGGGLDEIASIHSLNSGAFNFGRSVRVYLMSHGDLQSVRLGIRRCKAMIRRTGGANYSISRITDEPDTDPVVRCEPPRTLGNLWIAGVPFNGKRNAIVEANIGDRIDK